MKLYGSLKSRFVLIFTVFIALQCLITSYFAVSRSLAVTTSVYEDQGKFTAEKAASLIDGDSFQALVVSMDESDPSYEQTRIKLLELKQFSNCIYLYTMAPFSETAWVYVIDGSAPVEDEENFSALGTEEPLVDADVAMTDTYARRRRPYKAN